VLKSLLYRLLKRLVGVFFNVLNLLLAGNLPPFVGVCVIVEDQDKYLVVRQPGGSYVFPGGFMRWWEHPTQTALRECEEETGLRLRIKNLLGCSSNASDHFTRLSTLTVIYQAEVVDGELKDSVEGQPCWVDGVNLHDKLHELQKGTLEHYVLYREQGEQVKRFQV
jgi:ADP-ribose pyrophosphatase YjhB (NUDIX family)